MNMPWKKTLEKKAVKFYKLGAHDWGHMQRVRKMALEIGSKEKADLEVVEAAALLHDTGYEKTPEKHEQESARIAVQLLVKIPSFPKEKISRVKTVILSHRFSKRRLDKSIEAKCLRDADKLDAMGAIGVGRCFFWTGEHNEKWGAAVAHFPEKLLKLKGLMETKTGRKLAKERHAFLKKFYKKLKKEEG